MLSLSVAGLVFGFRFGVVAQYETKTNIPAIVQLERPLLASSHSVTSSNTKDEMDVTITGTVVDSNGSPIPGATVSVPGTNIGTATDIDGNYSITVPEGVRLVFSFIGYESKSVEIGNQQVIDVALVDSAQALDEIVVVGYGTQKKANLTGSVASVGSRDIENRPITSAATALQGTVSGVHINQNSGQAGRDGVQVNIRGIGTLNNSAPLVLVDGIEAPLNNINPDDIETVTVLKDAASAAIYGSRAANGVVLVTTKRGAAKGERVNFNYNGFIGTSEAIRLPDMVTNSVQFAELWNEGATNFGNPVRFSEEDINGFR